LRERLQPAERQESTGAFDRVDRAEDAGDQFPRVRFLLEGDKNIGSLSPNSWLGRDASVNLPADWPLAVKTFVIWLAIILWKRDAGSGS
jgi:hypothetical protein